MSERVCPDSPPDAESRGCWKAGSLELPEDIPIVDWLKAEMVDGLDHEYAHAVLGPALFGLDENGVPYFEVYRNEGRRAWLVRPKKDWPGPAELKGILDI